MAIAPIENEKSEGAKSSRLPKLLAISSGGGHWVELLRLRPAFEGFAVTYATVNEGYRAQTPGSGFHVIPNANRWNKASVIFCALGIFLLLLKLRPNMIITTGAAPGYLAVRIGKLLGAKTIWIDSIANAEELSLSGQMAGGKVDLWLTQWPHLQKENGPYFYGTIL